MLKVIVLVVKAKEGGFDESIHLPSVLLGRATRATGAIDETADTAHLQDLVLLWVGDILIDFGNQLGSYAALDRLENLEGIGDGRFAHIDYLARLDAAGGFHVDATHRHANRLGRL